MTISIFSTCAVLLSKYLSVGFKLVYNLINFLDKCFKINFFIVFESFVSGIDRIKIDLLDLGHCEVNTNTALFTFRKFEFKTLLIIDLSLGIVTIFIVSVTEIIIHYICIIWKHFKNVFFHFHITLFILHTLHKYVIISGIYHFCKDVITTNSVKNHCSKCCNYKSSSQKSVFYFSHVVIPRYYTVIF